MNNLSAHSTKILQSNIDHDSTIKHSTKILLQSIYSIVYNIVDHDIVQTGIITHCNGHGMVMMWYCSKANHNDHLGIENYIYIYLIHVYIYIYLIHIYIYIQIICIYIYVSYIYTYIYIYMNTHESFIDLHSNHPAAPPAF